MDKADGRLFLLVAKRFEEKGYLQAAWNTLAEVAMSSQPDDPVHQRLLEIELKMRKADAAVPSALPNSARHLTV